MKGLITICTECNTPTELKIIAIEFERKGIKAVMSGIPAMVCPQCGEQYVPGDIATVVVSTVSRLIDGTVDLLNQAHGLRQQLMPSVQSMMSERLELSLAA